MINNNDDSSNKKNDLTKHLGPGGFLAPDHRGHGVRRFYIHEGHEEGHFLF